MRKIILGIAVLWSGVAMSQNQKEVKLSSDKMIDWSTHFLPDQDKKGASVYFYDENGALLELRKGEGYLTCVYDNRAEETLEIDCYHDQLNDFMNRGRELKQVGKSVAEIREIRLSEIKDGSLYFPEDPSMLYVFKSSKKDINYASLEAPKGKLRYVIYTPFATQKSTGLPLSPAANGMPWLMDPGTHRAHIMVTPK